MKRLLWAVVIIAAVWGVPRLSHPAVDIGKLEPVEAVLLVGTETNITIQTNSGAEGTGRTLAKAIRDLRNSTGKEIYLDTTNKILVAGEMDGYWEELLITFRPSCKICEVNAKIDLKRAAEYLSVHKPEMTLNRMRSGETEWQILIMEEGRGRLVFQ